MLKVLFPQTPTHPSHSLHALFFFSYRMPPRRDSLYITPFFIGQVLDELGDGDFPPWRVSTLGSCVGLCLVLLLLFFFFFCLSSAGSDHQHRGGSGQCDQVSSLRRPGHHHDPLDGEGAVQHSLRLHRQEREQANQV